VTIKVNSDGYVDTVLSENDVPYECIIKAEVPLADGNNMLVTDYSSAGKTWNEDSKMAVWMLIK